MSGPSAPRSERDDPALDEGLLNAAPILEIGGFSAVRRLGGAAVSPWRGEALAARAVGITVTPRPPLGTRFSQALVRIGKGRDATWAALAQAAAALPADGILVITGANDLGIDGWIRRLRERLGPPLRVHARAKAKVAQFLRGDAAMPPPLATRVPRSVDGTATLYVEPGGFSGDGLDDGSALLLTYLATLALPTPRLIADLGCGAGHLAIGALTRWPSTRALCLDADHRAIDSVMRNLDDLGWHDRATAVWWDAAEAPPTAIGPDSARAELVLINPPAHQGDIVSIAPALAMFRATAALLAPGGTVLVVANRRLPYEQPLTQLGTITVVATTAGFKLLAVRHE